MIPLVLIILIYQVLAFLGVDAVSQIITYIAYRKQDLDIKLMYSQKPLDLIFNYNKFDKSSLQKMMIVFSAAFALSLGFIPTILTKLNRSVYIYSNIVQTPLNQLDAPWGVGDMPMFDNFLPFLKSYNSSNAIKDILVAYLKNNFQQNTTNNPSGVWYSAEPKPAKNFTNNQTGDIYGFLTRSKYIAFGFRHLDNAIPNSNSLTNCVGDKRAIKDYPDAVLGFDLTIAFNSSDVCYPMHDQTASIYTHEENETRLMFLLSVLSENDNIYRLPKLTPGVLAKGSFGVSLYNYNNEELVMGIKKMASITIYNYNNQIDLPTECNPLGKTSDATINFKDLPSNHILCHLLDELPSQHNASLKLSQARRRYFDKKNHAMNAVYTVQNEEGQSVMIDLNLFTLYSIEGQLADDKELLLAYESVKFGSEVYQENNMFQSTLANNNIEYILDRLDTTTLDEETIAKLIALASIKVRWSNNDFSDFIKITADVTTTMDISPLWMITIITLLVAFLLPQILRLFVRRNPYYSQDFRTILVSILDNKNIKSLERASEAKKVALVISKLGPGNLDASITINRDYIEVQYDNSSSNTELDRMSYDNE